MNTKIREVVVPLLLNHINRVKKRNEMKTEIRRVHASDKPEEDEERDEVEEFDEDKDKEKEKDHEISKEPMVDVGKDKTDEYKSHEFESLKFKDDGCEIVVKVPLNLKKFLMTKVVEKMLKTCIIREVQGIQSAIVLEKKDKK